MIGVVNLGCRPTFTLETRLQSGKWKVAEESCHRLKFVRNSLMRYQMLVVVAKSSGGPYPMFQSVLHC